MKINLDDLERKAKAATPVETELYGDRYFVGAYSRTDLTKAQDSYINAANPQVMLELIAMIRDLKIEFIELMEECLRDEE